MLESGFGDGLLAGAPVVFAPFVLGVTGPIGDSAP